MPNSSTNQSRYAIVSISVLVAQREVAKRLKVGQRLVVLDPPRPLATDGRTEAQFEKGVECPVGIFQDGPEHAVDLEGRDRGERDMPGQVDVTHAVDRPTDAVRANIALQQELVHRLAILVRSAHDERLY